MGTIANRKSLSAKVIAFLTSVALVLSFIPCMALPQMALADDAASGEAAVFTVYTIDSDGSNQRVAKAYTQAELEALVDSATAAQAKAAALASAAPATPLVPIIGASAAEIEGMNPAGKPYWTGANSITIVAPPVFKVSAEFFANGYYKVTYTEGVFEVTIIAMNGEDMFRDSETQEFVALVTKEQAEALTDASCTVVEVSEDHMIQEFMCDGDLNLNGKVNIVDAQISYDLAFGVYTDFAQVSMKQWLAGDMNNDGALDATDAFAIQYKVHHGAFAAE